MNKEEFLKELDEIIQDKLFIGNVMDDLEDEISQNNWSISIGQELAGKFTIEDLIVFFNQLKNSDHNMIFYVWFDWQSARLCFNLISDFHSTLPFRCDYKIIDNLEPILNDFLQFLYHGGFTIEEIEDEEVSEDKVNVEPFSVYSVTIPCD